MHHLAIEQATKNILKGFDEVLNGLEHSKDIRHHNAINPSLLPKKIYADGIHSAPRNKLEVSQTGLGGEISYCEEHTDNEWVNPMVSTRKPNQREAESLSKALNM